MIFLKHSIGLVVCLVSCFVLSTNPAQSESLDNLLMHSIEKNNHDGFVTALYSGANLFYENKNGATPLEKAIYARRFEMFSAMVNYLDDDTESKEDFSKALNYATSRLKDEPWYYDILLARGADSFRALPALCEIGEFGRAISVLSRPDVDRNRINEMNLPPRIVVSAYLHPRTLDDAAELLRILKNLNVEMNRKNFRGETAAANALELKLPRLLEILDIDREYLEQTKGMKSPSLERRLFDAAENNDLIAAEKLLHDHADPNGVNEGIANKNTPILAIAAAKGHVDMIKLLLRHGASLNAPPAATPPLTTYALRPVYQASKAAMAAEKDKKEEWLRKRSDRLETIEYLLSQEQDIDSSSIYGAAAIHEAASHYDTFVLEFLLKNGADPNLQSAKGITPLMVAMNKSNLAAARLLIQYGADPLMVDQEGKTATDKAYELKEVDLLRLVDTEQKYAKFVKEYTPSQDSPLIGTWSNGESGFSTVIIHFEPNGHGGMLNAIGIEFRFIWKAGTGGNVEMLFPPQRHLDVVITGTGPQTDMTLLGQFDRSRNALILNFKNKQEKGDNRAFTKVGKSWEQMRSESPEEAKRPTSEERLNSELEKLDQRNSFYLPGAGLQQLPQKLLDFPGLTKLTINANQLIEIPDWIDGLPKLVAIEAEKNHIKQISSAIGNLKELRQLSLKENHLETLPVEFSHLDLKRLDLENNRLAGFPDGFRFSSKLDFLSLNNNRLRHIGSALVSCSSLTFLNLSQNGLKNIDGPLVNLTLLRSLNLSFNRLKRVPDALIEIPHLEWLSLDHNQLVTLPTSFGRLSSLKELFLDNNHISILPNSINELNNLTYLSLANNSLTVLPATIGDMKAIKSLILNRNELKSIPAEISRLSKLTKLDLSVNHLGSLPENLSGLISLRSIDLSFNRFESFPSQIAQLPDLKEINISGNRIPKEQIEAFKKENPGIRFR